jgi:hypothetical protein
LDVQLALSADANELTKINYISRNDDYIKLSVNYEFIKNTMKPSIRSSKECCTERRSRSRRKESKDHPKNQDTRGRDLFKEVYIQVCSLLGVKPSPQVIKNCAYEEKSRMLRLEDCELSEENIKGVTYAIYSIGAARVYGLSLASNSPSFSDECLRSLSDIMPELTLLRSLDLSKINVSD